DQAEALRQPPHRARQAPRARPEAARAAHAPDPRGARDLLRHGRLRTPPARGARDARCRRRGPHALPALHGLPREAMAQEGDAAVGRFPAGGAIGDGAVYVERAADREILDVLAEGQLCYVFATTQSGKSSLKVRAMRALEADGVATVDITLDGGIPEHQW